MSQVTIELGREDANMDVFVNPLGSSLMGKFNPSNLGRGYINDIRAMSTPKTSGWRIKIDYKGKKIRVFHPLYKSDKAEREFRSRRHQSLNVAPPTEYDELDDETLQKWLTWAYRVTHDKEELCLASIVEGEFPKGTKEACDRQRAFDRHLATAIENIARERAWAAVDAEAVKELGPAK